MPVIKSSTMDTAAAAMSTTAAAASAPYQLLAEGMRTVAASQRAAWALGLEGLGRGQQLWWDQWRRLTDVGLAALVPVTAHRIDERFEAIERCAAERQGEVRAELERVTAELREAGQVQTRAVREVARDQRAGRTALDEAIEKLDGRLDRLAKAQAKQVQEVLAALGEQEQHLRDRLGERIRTAVGSIDTVKPADLEALRQQVAALAEMVTATRAEARGPAADARPASGKNPAESEAPKQ
jgi:hypothetical protein